MLYVNYIFYKGGLGVVGQDEPQLWKSLNIRLGAF